MAVLSVDLAYRSYADVGAVVLEGGYGFTECELLRLPLTSAPSPDALANYLDEVCVRKGIHLLLLDGLQGWKAKDNGLAHSPALREETEYTGEDRRADVGETGEL